MWLRYVTADDADHRRYFAGVSFFPGRPPLAKTAHRMLVDCSVSLAGMAGHSMYGLRNRMAMHGVQKAMQLQTADEQITADLFEGSPS